MRFLLAPVAEQLDERGEEKRLGNLFFIYPGLDTEVSLTTLLSSSMISPHHYCYYFPQRNASVIATLFALSNRVKWLIGDSTVQIKWIWVENELST